MKIENISWKFYAKNQVNAFPMVFLWDPWLCGSNEFSSVRLFFRPSVTKCPKCYAENRVDGSFFELKSTLLRFFLNQLTNFFRNCLFWVFKKTHIMLKVGLIVHFGARNEHVKFCPTLFICFFFSEIVLDDSY